MKFFREHTTPKAGRKSGSTRELVPGALSYEQWRKLRKPLIQGQPLFTKYEDPQERKKLETFRR